MLQDLAKKIQDDLVTRLRAARKKVLTYEDVKDEAVIAGQARLSADGKWGLPLKGGWGQPLTYLIASPTDAQAFDNPIQGPTWWMRNLAKEKNLVVLIPELMFSVPQMFGQTRAGVSTNRAGIATDPAMVLEGATVYGQDGKGPANIQVWRHGTRLAAEVTGTIEKVNADKTTFSAAWQRTSLDFAMTLDREAFTDGVLRVAYALNEMTVQKVTGKK